MLADAIGSYLDSLTEREFDAPFMALLRLQGFTDIHLLHGAFEFGKDFIAKRVEDGKHVTSTHSRRRPGTFSLVRWRRPPCEIDMLRIELVRALRTSSKSPGQPCPVCDHRQARRRSFHRGAKYREHLNAPRSRPIRDLCQVQWSTQLRWTGLLSVFISSNPRLWHYQIPELDSLLHWLDSWHSELADALESRQESLPQANRSLLSSTCPLSRRSP